MEVEGLEALDRPGFDAEGRRCTWNHRVVRVYAPTPENLRDVYGTQQTWLEVTEVHYVDGKPETYAIGLGTPVGAAEPDEQLDDDALLSQMRETLQRMLAATYQPILDEKTDFPAEDQEAA